MGLDLSAAVALADTMGIPGHGADSPVASGCMTVIERRIVSGVSGSGLMIRLVTRAVCYPGVIRTNLWRGLPHFLRSPGLVVF